MKTGNVKLINGCISLKDCLCNFPTIPIQTFYNGFSQKGYVKWWSNPEIDFIPKNKSMISWSQTKEDQMGG